HTQLTELLNVASDGTPGNGSVIDLDGPVMSTDGRFVAFGSDATNLVPNDTNTSPSRGCATPGCAEDIFVRDRQTGLTERVSVASDGTQADEESFSPAISADGRFVAFGSIASNLARADTNRFTDVFVHDRQTGLTERVSIASDGSQGNGFSGLPAISADGRYVAFVSDATDLVPGDTNGFADVFVRDRQTGTTERISVASGGTQANNYSGPGDHLAISSDGRFVAFSSRATNLVTSDLNGSQDVFVRDRVIGVTE